MSVLKSKRSESVIQFLDTARELEIYTLRYALKFPKRYTFFITNEIVRLAQSVYNETKSANSIYPTNAEEAQLRKNCFIRANCSLQCLISQLDIAKDLFCGDVDDKVWIKWIDLITTESKLIAAVKKSDSERFKFNS